MRSCRRCLDHLMMTVLLMYADEATWSESRVTLQGRANETAASRVPAR